MKSPLVTVVQVGMTDFLTNCPYIESLWFHEAHYLVADYSKHALFSRIHLMLVAQMKVSTEKRCILRGKRMTGLSIQVRQAPGPWIGEKNIASVRNCPDVTILNSMFGLFFGFFFFAFFFLFYGSYSSGTNLRTSGAHSSWAHAGFPPMSRVLPLYHYPPSFHKWGALLNCSGWVWGPWDLPISPNFYPCFQ